MLEGDENHTRPEGFVILAKARKMIARKQKFDEPRIQTLNGAKFLFNRNHIAAATRQLLEYSNVLDDDRRLVQIDVCQLAAQFGSMIFGIYLVKLNITAVLLTDQPHDQLTKKTFTCVRRPVEVEERLEPRLSA